MASSNEDPEPDAALESDFRESWAVRGFELFYQPQVDLLTKRVTAFEALLRWRHPVRGYVPPAAFIPLAEHLGLIDDIGRWVLERACQDAVAWPDTINIAVNVSALQLRKADFPEWVAQALQRSGVAPSRLELEITETAPAGSQELDVLHKIKDTGVRIVMDDFDRGCSTLNYLTGFPFDKIKMDKSIVHALGTTRPDHATARAIVRAIIFLCRDLNISFLAEGVETDEQMALLADAGCPAIQGYLCGRPLPAVSVPGALQSALVPLEKLTNHVKASKPHNIPSSLENIPFFQIAESANDIIIVTTPDIDPPGPKIVYVNPAFVRLTGYSVVEAVGQSPRILQGPGTSRTTRETIYTTLRSGKPVHEKILNFGKSGAPYWLDLKIFGLHDPQGKLSHFVAIERDVTMDKRRLDELEYLADRDTLTGIPNRRAFLRALASEIASVQARKLSAANPRGPCLAFIDVDHFKATNDRLGHVVGDAVLCGLADCLAENVRRLDILGRMGGEEFAVCMPSVTLPEAKALAERLRRSVADVQMETPLGPVGVTVSIGVACFQAGDSITTMTDRADAAMYAAKRAGRNRVRVHAPKSRSRTGSVDPIEQ